MRDYTSWMSPIDTFESEELAFDLCEKSEVKINSSVLQFDCIINDANEWQRYVDKIFLMKKSEYILKKGDIINDGINNYIIYFDIEDRGFFNSGKGRLCNGTIKVKTGQTQTLTGYDSLGRPIYQTVNTFDDFPCIIESKTRISTDVERAINIPDGRVVINISYRPELNLDMNSTFTMYDQSWKIVEIDYTNTDFGHSGVFTFSAERER